MEQREKIRETYSEYTKYLLIHCKDRLSMLESHPDSTVVNWLNVIEEMRELRMAWLFLGAS